MSWQLSTFRFWSYAFTLASGGIVATLLIQSRLHTSTLNAQEDGTKQRVCQQEVLQDSVDVQSLMDPSDKERIDGGVKFLKKMLADKLSDGNYEQKLVADNLQHEHVSADSPICSHQVASVLS